ncbi:MAG: alkaline phosphatase family protein [Minicystis sp.]
MRNRFLALPSAFVVLALAACGSGGAATTGSGGSGGHPTTTTGGAGHGGQGGAPAPGPSAWNRDVTPPPDDEAAAKRLACAYKAGSLPAETQGASHPSGAGIPIDHIIVVMQENRSFDHYFMKLPEKGQTDVEVAPAAFTNPDAQNKPIAPYHDTAYCLVDTNHSWAGLHLEYGGGKMDGFVLANDNAGTPPPHPLTDSMSGVRAMSYYDDTDIPFYYFLANEFAIADHYHCSLLGPTWPNRMYLYAASSRGATENKLVSFSDRKGACATDAECGGAAGSCVNGGCKGTCQADTDCGVDAPAGTCDVAGGGVCGKIGRTLFDYLEQRKVDWKVYATLTPGFALTLDAWLQYREEHQKTIDDYYADAAAGTLPAVAFVDPHIGAEAYNQDDEHPPASPQPGQQFVAKVIDALTKSPNWSRSALFVTYDEHGGLWDHVPPPEACPPGDIAPAIDPGDPPGDFDRYGVRVPMIVVSPFAKKHFVGHHVYDHTSIVRFIEDRFTIGAITNRDANAEAPWEMFDFASPPHATPPAITIPTIDQAKMDACKAVWVP